MLIEIFETRGFGSELPTDLDALIINLNRKHPQITVKKLDVLNKDMMKSHKDIVKMLKENSLEILPLIKINGKLINPEKAEEMIYKHL
jgi:hypothetical protein